MKFIYAALAAALSFVTGGSQREQALVKANADLTEQNADLSSNLAGLHTAFDALKTEDDAAKAALEQSKTDLATSQTDAAKSAADFQALSAQVDDASTKSQALLSTISGITGIPITVEDGTVNHDTEHESNDATAVTVLPTEPAPELPTDPSSPVTNDATPV